MVRPTKSAASKLSIVFAAALLVFAIGPFGGSTAAAPLNARSIELSDSRPGQTNVTYNVHFDTNAVGLLGSVEILFCNNSALPDDPCTPPVGFDASAANLLVQTGLIGFNVSPSSTANDIILTRPPGPTLPVVANFVFDGITNPSTNDPVFARIMTYSNSSATQPFDDFGAMALAMTGPFDVNAEVPPYLIFCLGENITGFDCNTATDPFSNLGTLSPTTAAAAQHQVVIATNAQNGYSMWAAGTTMTSGNNTIAALSSGPVTSQPGTAQFGMNLRANSSPGIGADAQGPGVGTAMPNFNQPNHFYFHSGDMLASTPTSDAYRKYTVSYIVNVPDGQPGGVYSTTLTYVCLANF